MIQCTLGDASKDNGNDENKNKNENFVVKINIGKTLEYHSLSQV